MLFYSLFIILLISLIFGIVLQQFKTEISPFTVLKNIMVQIKNNSLLAAGPAGHSPSNPTTPKCALLFFGLIKESFATISLPSIQKYIVSINPTCDIFLHTYNVTHLPPNQRNGEHDPSLQVNISQVYLLTHNVTLESMDAFYKARQNVLNRTRRFHHTKWGDCCTSHDNMIKQWHSIQGVWDLMMMMITMTVGGVSHYEQVGLFRSDVYYTRPIDILDSKAAVPNFAHHHGYNDRLFYGTYENAKIWASQRFSFLDTFEKVYMRHDDLELQIHPLDAWSKIRKLFDKRRRRSYNQGYHSETFVKSLLDHHGVRLDLKDHCVWRVRSGCKILASDCDGMKGFSTFDDIRRYSPKNVSSSSLGDDGSGCGGGKAVTLVVV